MRARIAVLASGRGSNLHAILDYLDAQSGRAAYEVAAVISNNSGAPALDLARARGIPAFAIDPSTDREGAELLGLLDRNKIDLVALAGYLKKIPREVVGAFEGRMLNVHPALLPAHGGAGMYGIRVHEAVISAGDSETGVTVHIVDTDYDRGPVVAQWRVPVLPGDDAKSLAERVLSVEHTLYPRAIEIVAALYHMRSDS
ncbi:MAG: phosphoribosylglycinamide formyltransferase [Gemmatimonadota bacterium]|nr:phosphoribosylglycinamide formyltransferase [Gemmatimonadota bacterium]